MRAIVLIVFRSQWTAAFTPTPQQSQQSPPPVASAAHVAAAYNPRSGAPDNLSTYAAQQSSTYPPHSAQVSAATAQTSYQQQIPQQQLPPGYVSAGQWQELVTSSFSEGGLKRRWNHAYGLDMGGMQKRSR